MSFSLQFGVGSVIGVGYDCVSKEVFYTQNGIMIPKRVKAECGLMYPSIAANHNWEVHVNFGQERFSYAAANIL
jgi:SPRY domain